MESIQTFVNAFLALAGDAHLGLFLFVWFSSINPVAPPEEMFTLVGGTLIAKGILDPFWGGLSIIGGIISTNISQYWMGRGGLKLLSGTKIGNRFVNSRKFKNARDLMEKRGIWAIVACRFFFGTRAFTYFASGFLRYRFVKFVSVDSSMVLIHGIPLLILGYLFSDQIGSIFDFMEKLGIWNLIILLIIIAAIITYRRLRTRHRAKVLGNNRG